MFNIFPLHAADFYKVSHYQQYPVGMTKLYSNFTCRSDKWFQGLPDFDHKTLMFGAQSLCQWLLVDLWNEEFFNKPKKKVVAKYKRRMDRALGEGAICMAHIEALHDLGYLPIRIKALPEGSRVNIRVPLMTITNTHDDFGWVTNYIETQLSAEFWKPVANATMAFEYRRLLQHYAKETGSSLDFVPWQGHDFADRGMSGVWDGMSTGAAHLLSFYGTDSIGSLDYMDEFYSGEEAPILGSSVFASEHSCSVTNILSRSAKEIEAATPIFSDFDYPEDRRHLLVSEYLNLKRFITEIYPSGIASYVSDTFDFWSVLTVLAPKLYKEITNRNGKLVFRPDSGDPVKIIIGDPDATPGSPEFKGAVECLWEIFGGTITDNVYKVLDSHIGLIYGDSITLERAQAILEGLKRKGFASCNIVFGIGSYTYNFCTRDTFGSAVKATWAMIDGKPIELFKDPLTDNGLKKSLCGLIRVEKENGNYVVYDHQTPKQEKQGELKLLFENSKMMRHETINEIRERLLVEL